MSLQVYYLIRSKADGSYLLAHPNPDSAYLLIFREHFDALGYLNTHAWDIAAQFAVESVPSTQVGNLLKRWGFSGVGIVQDPLFPKIDFFPGN